MLVARLLRLTLRGTLACACVSACKAETPPKPQVKPVNNGPNEAAAEPPSFVPGETKAILTYAAERGSFADGQDASAIPERARGMVRVSLLEGPQPPSGQVWVANLEGGDDSVRLTTVAREMFEELALGRGLRSEVKLPEGIEPPPQVAANAGEVIVYKTAWCGVCKKVQSYLDRKGVTYKTKDIEKDRAAAAELQAKATKAGISMGSVPVIDVGGELMVGFDRARLEKMLAG